MTSETREIAHDQHSHPTARFYVIVGLILAALTAIEIALYYFEDTVGGRSVAVPLLLFLSTIKFIMVVMYFMHLKFDSRIFTGVFLFPFTLGTLVILALIMLYRVLPNIPV